MDDVKIKKAVFKDTILQVLITSILLSLVVYILWQNALSVFFALFLSFAAFICGLWASSPPLATFSDAERKTFYEQTARTWRITVILAIFGLSAFLCAYFVFKVDVTVSIITSVIAMNVIQLGMSLLFQKRVAS